MKRQPRNYVYFTGLRNGEDNYSIWRNGTSVKRCVILLESKSKQTLILGNLYSIIRFIWTNLSITIHRTKIRKSLFLLWRFNYVNKLGSKMGYSSFSNQFRLTPFLLCSYFIMNTNRNHNVILKLTKCFKTWVKG